MAMRVTAKYKAYLKLQAYKKQLAKILPEGPRPPVIFTYTRCSHLDSAQSGLGLEAQDSTVAGYLNFIRESVPNAVVAPPLRDEVVSAYRTPLAERPSGSLLCGALQPGDHVIFARIDRAFRNFRDMMKMTDEWNKKGITYHFAMERIDVSTATGRLIMDLLCRLAQWQSEYIGERNKEAIASMKASGRWKKDRRKAGFRFVMRDGKRIRVPDPVYRAIASRIVTLREEDEMCFADISDQIERELAASEGRKYPERWDERTWSAAVCQLAYRRELELRAETEAALSPSQKKSLEKFKEA